MQLSEDDFEDVLECARTLLAAETSAEVDSNQNEDLLDAQDLINRALQLRPKDHQAWILKAQVLSAQGDDFAAFGAIEMSIARAPLSAEGHYWRGAILADLGQHSEALSSISAAFRLVLAADEWLLEDLFCEKIAVLEALERTGEAVATLGEALEAFPDSPALAQGAKRLERVSVRSTLTLIDGGLAQVRPTR